MSKFRLRETELGDIDSIIELCGEVYPGMYSWGPQQLGSQLDIFPEGQFVVTTSPPAPETEKLVGMASSVILDYSNYNGLSKWSELTDWGYLGNHDPEYGSTLYGVEIMVHPSFQGMGIGKMIYAKREDFARARKLTNIRAGARISGFYLHAAAMTAPEYLQKVVSGELTDPTLSFQLKRGFKVIGLTPRYFHDPQSLNYAAVIEYGLK